MTSEPQSRQFYYILDADGHAVPCDDLLKMAEWKEQNFAECVVAKTRIRDVLVSTVFLCIDHGTGTDAPLLWETLVFGGAHDGDVERYTSRAAAEAGHTRICALRKGWTA